MLLQLQLKQKANMLTETETMNKQMIKQYKWNSKRKQKPDFQKRIYIP